MSIDAATERPAGAGRSGPLAPAWVRTAGFLLLLAGGITFFLAALRYFGPVDDPHFAPRLTTLRIHIVSGAVALLLGPLQFVAALRRRRPDVHRWIGRTYLAGIAVGGGSGLVLAAFANGGLLGQTGFAGLSLAWLATSGVALAAIRRGRVSRHRQWMIRSYALTLAFVWVRLLLGVGFVAGAEMQAVFGVAAWASWVVPLVVVEAAFRSRGRAILGGG